MKLLLPHEELHRKIYFLALVLLAFSLPLNRYLISIPKYLLLLNWILEGNYRQKLRMIREKPALLVFISMFLLYSAGSFFSENRKAAFEIVLYAQTLLLIPVILGTSVVLSEKKIKQLLLVFPGAVMAASLLCVILYMVNGLPAGSDFRAILVFKPNNRFALEIIMAIFILFYFFITKGRALPDTGSQAYPVNPLSIRSEKLLLFAGALILTGLLFFFKSLTGIIIFILLSFLWALHAALKSRQKLIGYGALLFMVFIVLGIAGIGTFTWHRNFIVHPADPGSLEKFTANGHPYTHNLVSGVMENGHLTEIYVCEDELQREWNRISVIPYDKTDGKGQEISSTLKRYLTSKGLRKDSAALHTLSATDLVNIQRGLANYRFHENPGLCQRMYESLWEIHVLLNTGYVEHHSFTQRLIFLEIAGRLIRESLWTGTGPGDVCDAMRARAASDGFSISELWIGKPHNQFAFYLLAFGMAGFIWIAFCWMYPAITAGAHRVLLFNLFSGIILISMLTLDTLESYDSITFVAFFYSLFVFGSDQQKKS